MKIKITTAQNSQLSSKLLPVITDAHNLRYSHTSQNCIYFQCFRFPYKSMVQNVAPYENGIVRFSKSYIRAVIKRQETVLQFVFRYTVEKVERRKGQELKRRTVTEKERVYIIEANRDEIIQLVEPLLVELENVNGEKSAALYIQSYNDWAYPLTVESVVSGLTEGQKRIAARLLKAYFVL